MEFLPEINGEYEELPGEFLLPEQFGLKEGFQESNQVFSGRMQHLGNYKISPEKENIIFYQEEPIEDEAYRLHIEKGRITICASGEKGYSYGLTTLYQMAARG